MYFVKVKTFYSTILVHISRNNHKICYLIMQNVHLVLITKYSKSTESSDTFIRYLYLQQDLFANSSRNTYEFFELVDHKLVW